MEPAIDELPPSILPEIEEDLKRYLIHPEQLPIHCFERNQEYWPRQANIPSLMRYDNNHSSISTTLKVQRDPNTGRIIDFYEVPIKSAGNDAKNSLSLSRAPIPPEEATRGNAAYLPFWPAGFPDPVSDLKLHQDSDKANDDEEELLMIPPGFNEGLCFADDNVTVTSNSVRRTGKNPLQGNVINLMDVVREEQKLLDIWQKETEIDVSRIISSQTDDDTVDRKIVSADDEEIIFRELPVLNISDMSRAAPTTSTSGKSTEWAVLLDTSKPVTNFEESVPEMAMRYDFELDTFQKLAIMQLERHDHVFVAAHTSAGKTVVAEYAIALSQKHLTRCVYTSPIKALSNQKYRDFKKKFGDVGLITGDFQINATASCLIMTTEILRSMLFCGSELTRDLEYVIFDEVHYINDEDRGHVWEQTLILLPAHVTVILLSATVPNAIEFADWLGRNYQRKVYVVTTSKRPVPLKHYLHTGTGDKTKDNRYLIMDHRGWNQEGFIKAKETVKDTDKRPSTLTPKAERTLWIALIDHLKRNQLLPVVAFTFSRAKCDQNAYNLTSIDLTVEKEKHRIYKFFDDCVKTLKEADRNIPQIVNMKDILLRGIGIHHSGILPILKEIVEMLFQNGLIKLLFATETFAMGVNMPARTVIFDSITKHDGRERRTLLPAEYIQMAGRAGRRGLDKEGIVIILSKHQPPNEIEMRKMMTCLPKQLESQFRLTYSMVLSLLRKESFSVEEVMSRSFKEAHYQKNKTNVREQIKSIKEKIESKYRNNAIEEYLKPLVKYYEKVRDYLETWNLVMANVLKNRKVIKDLTPGRLLLICHKQHMNKLAVLLNVTSRTQVTYDVLVLTNIEDDSNDENKSPDRFYKMLSFVSDNYIPIGSVGHQVLTIMGTDIMRIFKKSIKIDAELVLNDWKKRQIPRFKDDGPGQACQNALRELQKLTLTDEVSNLESIVVTPDDLELNVAVHYLNVLRSQIDNLRPTDNMLNFVQNFRDVYERMSLEDELKRLEFTESHKSLSLMPEYENRIGVLQELCYIDEQRHIELKGKVACEIGMNELMITELVLENIFKQLKPAEVAALLSSLVFQQKVNLNDKDMTEPIEKSLEKGRDHMIKVADKIQRLEHSHRVDTLTPNLNFGLVNVVYKWATNTPFVEIMQETTMQEGIIVRCILQLNEIILDVRNAARIIGDPELQNKMEEASAAIKRDIVFAASLYTQREADHI